MQKKGEEMKLPKGDNENHSCLKAYGKVSHVSRDHSNNWFCAYCGKPLKFEQLAKRWQEEYNLRKLR